jgi:hypothetical protein
MTFEDALNLGEVKVDYCEIKLKIVAPCATNEKINN